jgi:D-alanyl-D-alanine carboxypeptidase (penicillin-binding protein 5/6)
MKSARADFIELRPKVAMEVMPMKKSLIVLFLVLFAVTAADARTKSKKQVPDVKKEEPACQAYMVAEAATGKVLEGREAHLKWPPASLTKLMPALIVMEKLSAAELRLDDRVTVSRKASKMGGSQVYLKEGETFTLEELMKAMLVASANDAAYAIAELVAGSEEQFIHLMNEKAKALNMSDTTFRSVHGLPPSKDEEEDVTSSHDLTLLSRAVLRYPKILEWTSIKQDSFRDGMFVLTNHNKLLIKMPGMDGLKTGYYRKAGYNVVATAEKKNLRLIVVVLGSPTAKARDTFAIERLKANFSLYEMVQVVKKGDLIDRDILLPHGEDQKLKGIAGNAFSYPVPSKSRNLLTREILLPEKIEGDIKENQKLGDVVIRFDNQEVGRVDIVAPKAVPKAGSFTIFRRKIGLGS